MSIFIVPNGAAPTTAAPVAVTTGAVLKTMLQVLPLVPLRIIEWGFSFNASALAVPIVVELLETGTVFGTVTAHVEGGITKVNDLSVLAASMMTFGTAATGYTASAEGTVIASRLLDTAQFMSVLSQSFIKQFPLGQEPVLTISNACRIRVTAQAAVNMYCYLRLSS